MAKQYLRLLSKEDLQKIHHASLTILQNTGMLIDHYEARKMIRAAGADVEDEKKIVKFPPELVEKCLKAIPRRLLYAGRNLENDLILQADGGIYARTASSITSYFHRTFRKPQVCFATAGKELTLYKSPNSSPSKSCSFSTIVQI